MKEPLHFDIRLDDATGMTGPDPAPAGHQVRKTLMHPRPSIEYHPVFNGVLETPLRPGISCVRINEYHPDPRHYTFKSSRSPLLFAYVLQGKRCFTFQNTSGQVATRQGFWYVGYIPESEGSGILTGAPMLRAVHLRFDPLALYELLEGEISGFPRDLSQLLKHLEGGTITLGGRMTMAMKAVAGQVLQCPCGTAGQRLFLESRMLDLLGLHLEELHDGQYQVSGPQSETGSGTGDAALARETRDILMGSLQAPPSLDRISTRLGATSLKVKSAFVKRFGVSLHRYVHTRRMEAARRLLEQGRHNVNEVASQVGYANASRFIEAFHRSHGVKPGEFSRQFRRFHPVPLPLGGHDHA